MELKSFFRALEEYLSDPRIKNPNFDDTNYRYTQLQLKHAYDSLAYLISRGKEDPSRLSPDDVTAALQSLNLIARLNDFKIEWSKTDKNGIPTVVGKK
jgi:hypothetical protein